MKNNSLIILTVGSLAGFAGACFIHQQPHRQPQIITASSMQSTTCQAYFSPNGGCTLAVVTALKAAKTSILVQAYTFTSTAIAEALVTAQHRGVNVEVILDKSDLQGKGEQTAYLAESDIPLSIDSAHAIAHNKVMIIDGETVITGSFNFTVSAEKRNAENLLIVQDKVLATKYTEVWQKHRAHSQEYKGPTTTHQGSGISKP